MLNHHKEINHLSPSISVKIVLDNFWRKCYIVDDESFEAEEFFKTCNLHGATLECAYSDLFDLNHCDTKRYACNSTKLLRLDNQICSNNAYTHRYGSLL